MQLAALSRYLLQSERVQNTMCEQRVKYQLSRLPPDSDVLMLGKWVRTRSCPQLVSGVLVPHRNSHSLETQDQRTFAFSLQKDILDN